MERQQVFFVRHGESAHNIDPAALQTPDNPLTDVGKQQAGVAGGVLRQIAEEWGGFDLVVTSPMTRTVETCLIAMDASGLDHPAPVILPLLT